MTNKSIAISCNPEMKEINLLSVLYNKATNLPNTIREKICSEFNWSEPTFYRKMRSVPNENKLLKSLSILEKRTIAEIILAEYDCNLKHLTNTIKSQHKHI